jgi:hypothetical protein
MIVSEFCVLQVQVDVSKIAKVLDDVHGGVCVNEAARLKPTEHICALQQLHILDKVLVNKWFAEDGHQTRYFLFFGISIRNYSFSKIKFDPVRYPF